MVGENPIRHPAAEADASAPPNRARLIVVSGMSGSGKSVALRTLEDLDFYCVDNLPVALMPAFVESLTRDPVARDRRLAIGIDARNRGDDLGRVPAMLGELATAEIDYRLVFLDTRDEVLIQRYSESRRRHPLSVDGRSLGEAIALERNLLKPLRAIADRVIDTSESNVHQLRRAMVTEMGLATKPLTLLFESFAYRRGLPADADFVFDARCLPNPHWDVRLRPFSGRDAPVRQWLEEQADVVRMRDDIVAFLDAWLPRFEAEGRSYVTVCIGCTGGRHRSVYLAEHLAGHFRARYEQVASYHREIEG